MKSKNSISPFYQSDLFDNMEPEEDILLGMASPRYEPLQNRDAFKFFDKIVGENAAVFETAGALGDGERVWVLAKLPNAIRVIGNDIIDKYLLLSNTHNGRESVTIKFTPIRVVCQNTLIVALQDGEKSIKIRHTKSMHKRLSEAPDLLGIVKIVYRKAEESFRIIANTHINTTQLGEYLETLFPRTKEDKEIDKWPVKWNDITALFEIGDPDLPECQGTLWAAYNAVTRYEDYRQAKESSPDQRLNRVWFGNGADLKLKALQKAEELAHQWLF